MSEFKQHGHYQSIPSYDDLITPYRDLAKRQLLYEVDKKITDCQHYIASQCGFADWQSLTYFLKTAIKLLGTIRLSDEEWGFIYDVHNGWLVGDIKGKAKEHLMVQVIDADRYDILSSKWFDDPSLVDNYNDDWTPSGSMRVFLEKLDKCSEQQCRAIILKGLAFWDSTGCFPN